MNLNTTKNMGGIGAILMFIGVFPYINAFGIIPLIGLILVMAAAKGLADYYSEDGIFNNALYGVITAIAGVVITVALAFVAFVNVFRDLGFTLSNMQDWQNIGQQLTRTDFMNAFWNAAGYIFLALAILFIFMLVAAIFFRKSMVLTSRKSSVGLFGSAGMVLLIGAVLTIIFFGIFLIWISLLLIAIAFFQLRPHEPAQAAPPPTLTPTST